MGKLPLFDRQSIKEITVSNRPKTDYSILATATETEFIAIRNYLEDWYSRFPITGRNDLKARFKSPRKISFHSAFFELFLHELLIKLNAKVTLHKETETNKTTLPDFYVVDSISNESYVEATVVTGKSKNRQAEEERLKQLLINLNKMIFSTDFGLAVESQGYPRESISAKRIAAKINKNIELLDKDLIREIFLNKDFEELPKWRFDANGCVLIFEPIPMIQSRKGSASQGPIHIHTGSVEFVDHHSPLRKAITKKANRYGKLSYPFVVAINCLEPIDDIDVMNALFGQEQFHIPINPGKQISADDIVFSRKRNGALTNPIGPRYSRVSGILVATNLRPWSINESKLCLYHNPWRNQEYNSVLNSLNNATLKGEKMNWVEGQTLSDVLEIET